jgi:hypothetical protein
MDAGPLHAMGPNCKHHYVLMRMPQDFHVEHQLVLVLLCVFSIEMKESRKLNKQRIGQMEFFISLYGTTSVKIP